MTDRKTMTEVLREGAVFIADGGAEVGRGRTHAEINEVQGETMPFPATRDAMIQNGYVFSNHARCKACQDEIEWFTTPRGKKMPFNAMPKGDSPAVSHHSTCPDADLFRNPR